MNPYYVSKKIPVKTWRVSINSCLKQREIDSNGFGNEYKSSYKRLCFLLWLQCVIDTTLVEEKYLIKYLFNISCNT